MDLSRWMSLDPVLHHKKLAHICLPMTHDSGTFDLSDEMAPDPKPWIVEVQKVVADVAKILNDSGILPYGMDPLAWGMAEVIGSVKGLATATKQNVAAQLKNGIRGFDFRLYNKGGTYYTYHGLKSTSTFGTMLDDIRTFLADTTRSGQPVGEIVYVTMSHFNSFSDEDHGTFAKFVTDRLGKFAYLREKGRDNDPFQRTYREIIGQGGTFQSRVILVNSHDLPEDLHFWPEPYSPPNEHRDKNHLAGRYTDTSSLRTMIKGQVELFKDAVADNLPVATYMTLTPSPSEYVNICVSSLSGALMVLSADFPSLAPIVVPLALGLMVDRALIPWTTLEQLSSRVNRRLPEIIDDNFVPLAGANNRMSMIYCDYWEHSQVVEQCIALSSNFEMQWRGDAVIKVGDTELRSDEGPAAAMFEGRLHMIYKEDGGNDLSMAIFDPLKRKWSSTQKLRNMPGGTSSFVTDDSPSCATLGDVLHVVWKTLGKNSIRSASYDGAAWSGGGEITIASPGRNPETSSSPYLANYGDDELVMVHKFKSDNDIHWERYGDGTWSGGHKIEVTDNSKETKPGTNKHPAIIDYAGKLHLVYKGAHSNELFECLNGGGNWTGNTKIRDKADKFTPKSNRGPALARFANSIYLVYKGESDDIWVSQYNGVSWEGNESLKDLTRKNSKISPQTSHSPWAVRAGVDLVLLYSHKNKLYETYLRPVKLGGE